MSAIDLPRLSDASILHAHKECHKDPSETSPVSDLCLAFTFEPKIESLVLSFLERPEIGTAFQCCKSNGTRGYAETSVAALRTRCEDTTKAGQRRMEEIWKEVNANKEPLLCGHGEYLFYLSNGESISPVLYQKAYEAHVACKTEFFKEAQDKEISRLDFFKTLQARLQAIDPLLQCMFFPRTSYELEFLALATAEEIDVAQREKLPYEETMGKRFWQPRTFFNEGSDLDPKVLKQAFQMNQHLLTKIQSYGYKGALNFDQILKLAEKPLEYLTSFHKMSGSPQHLSTSKLQGLISLDWGTAYKFTSDWPKNGLAISKEEIRVIHHALALECCSYSNHHLIAVRGGDFHLDDALELDGKINSVSLGSSLFAGSFYDTGACTWSFKMRGIHALLIPFNALGKTHQIPTTHTICQLGGMYEDFHGRSMISSDARGHKGFGSSTHCRDIEKAIHGLEVIRFQGSPTRSSDAGNFQSPLCTKELLERFWTIQRRAVFL
ncbi:MAG TPA: hypothetical protein VLG44_06905 [Chlamydiales bacterium]|nr:hypothetical protein [Chlamydiales bacterium]